MTAASRDDFLTELTEGFAQLLAAEVDQVQRFAWQPSGRYAADVVGGFVATMPTDPDKIWVLTPIPYDAHPTLTDARVDLQIRFRAGADIRDVWAMRDATRPVLKGRFPMRLPTGVYVSSLAFAYGTSMGQDQRDRWEWADNYRLRVTEPAN